MEAPENYVQVGFENVLLKDGKEVPLNEVADGGAYQEAKKAPITITVDSDTVQDVYKRQGIEIILSYPIRQQKNSSKIRLIMMRYG